jgi:SMI1 / KNR4 family (SUKH-1)
MKELVPQRGYSWVERLPEVELARAEGLLGFPLPPLLRRVYLEVGEGAFGLSPLYEERSNGLDMPLVDSYLELRSDQEGDAHGAGRWPENLLIIYDWGCNIYSCLDCAHPEYRVLRNDNNRDSDAYALEAPSLQQWLQALLDDTLHFEWDTAEKVTL